MSAFTEGLDRYTRLLDSLVTLRTWEKRMSLGKTVSLAPSSDAGLQVPEIIETVERELASLIKTCKRLGKAKRVPNLVTTPAYAHTRASRQRQRAKVDEKLKRYCRIYRKDLLEEFYD